MDLDELDVLAARHVMGWPETNFEMAVFSNTDTVGRLPIARAWTQKAYTDGKRVVMKSGGSYPYNVEKWNPTRDIKQAFECLDKNKCGFKIHNNSMGYFFCDLILHPVSTGNWVEGKGETVSEAIVRACLAAKGVKL